MATKRIRAQYQQESTKISWIYNKEKWLEKINPHKAYSEQIS